MRLHSLSLSGYMPFAHDKAIEMTDFSDRNIIIGPNNAGKSSVFRFLNFLKGHFTNSNRLETNLFNRQFNSSCFWKHNTNYPILATISANLAKQQVLFDYNTLDGILKDGQWRFSLTISDTPVSTSSFERLLTVVPHRHFDEAWFPDTIIEQNTGDTKYLIGADKYDKHRGRTDYKSVSALLQYWADSMRFFDPVRALDRSSGKRKMDDGSSLIADLHRRFHNKHNPNAFRKLKDQILYLINCMFEPSGIPTISDFEIKGTTPQAAAMYLTVNNIPVPLESMGSGLAELILICTSIVIDGTNELQYFIEEPETHLHPGLLRRFIQQLRNHKNIQFFFSTHSSEFLDCLTEGDRLFHFRQEPEGHSIVDSCTNIVQAHGVLDRLGIRGSSLLQSNCAIWVEGPSDRLYIRKWLNDLAVERSIKLVEGSDYCFLFYGGKVLSHFDLECDSEDDLIAMLRASRFSAVVMDKDLPNNASDEKLRQAKERIRNAMASDSQHRLAIITHGREIENDIPLEPLKAAALAKLALPKGSLDGLILTGERRFGEEIADFLKITDKDKRKSIIANLHKKIPLATAILQQCSDGQALVPRPSYIETLLKMIKRARLE